MIVHHFADSQMRQILTSSVIAILAMSTTAVKATDWSGFYFGILAGSASATGVNEADLSSGILPSFDIGDTIEMSGMLGGMYAGINIMSDQLLLGLEGDASAGSIEGSLSYVDTESITSTIDWSGHLRGRVGVEANGLLFFVAGGLAVASNGVFADGDFQGTDEDSATHIGGTIGGGVEVALTDNLFARAEYLYDDYGTADYRLFGGTWSQNISSQIVRVGLSFKP